MAATEEFDLSSYSLLKPGELSDPADRNITFADVLALIPRDEGGDLQLDAVGVSTNDIRKALGRGSYSTIGKFLRIIRELDRLAKEPQAANEPPSPPKDLVLAIWREAYSAARLENAERMAKTASDLLAAREANKELNEEISAAYGELDAKESVIAALNDDLSKTSEQLGAALQAKSDSEQTHQLEIERLNAKIAEIEASHHVVVKDMNAKFEHERLEWRAARTHLESAQQRLEDRIIELRAFEKYVQEHHQAPSKKTD